MEMMALTSQAIMRIMHSVNATSHLHDIGRGLYTFNAFLAFITALLRYHSHITQFTYLKV